MFFERIHNIFNWGDKLTRYNGETITYDEIGNPLSYRDGMEMSWLNGRKLTTLQSGNDSISYKYDSNGVITSKTVNGVEYTYEYLNGHLMHETRGEKVFDYCYDANGQLYAVSYKANSSTDAVTYYFAHNWRGDITSIYDAGGNVVAKYEYDDWGNVLTVTDANNKSITDKNHIANLNPFRYRSYYYDSKSGFYYLMSRYYDPVVHRFINADGYFQSGDSILDTNMNAYCRNNPIMYSDPTGEHSSSVTCGDPTCFQCREDRRDFVNSRIDWYNEIMGTDLEGIDFWGNPIQKPHLTVDNNSTESKVIRTIFTVIACVEFNVDIGFGIGAETNIMSIIGFDAYSKAALAISFSLYDGFDIGVCAGNSFGASIWDIGPNFGMSSFYSFISQETTADVGFSRKIGVSDGLYCGVGGSVGIDYNYGLLFDKFKEIWW